MADPSAYDYTRDYTPYAGDYSSYGSGPEHLFVGDVRKAKQPPPAPQPGPVGSGLAGGEAYYEDGNSWEGGEGEYWDASWGGQRGTSTPSEPDDPWSFLPGRSGALPAETKPPGMLDKFGSFIPGYDSVQEINKGNYGHGNMGGSEGHRRVCFPAARHRHVYR